MDASKPCPRSNESRHLILRIQRFYRCRCLKQYVRAVFLTRKLKYLLHLQCSLILQSSARRYFAKRDARVQKSLCTTIQDSHPSVVIVAIEQHRVQQNLFSTRYNSFENIKKQYDHCQLLRSSSLMNNRLLLREMQRDILIIAGLIVKRKTELSVKIQTTWRKEAAQNRFCIYKQLLWHQCKIKHTRVILIQNCYRGFVGREVKRTLQSQHAKMKLMESYKAERRQNKKLREYAMSREVIQKTYVRAVAKDRLHRYMNGYRTSSS